MNIPELTDALFIFIDKNKKNERTYPPVIYFLAEVSIILLFVLVSIGVILQFLYRCPLYFLYFLMWFFLPKHWYEKSSLYRWMNADAN